VVNADRRNSTGKRRVYRTAGRETKQGVWIVDLRGG
jgi:hypothetical protein